MIENDLVYIDTCIVQKDRRIRIPQSLLENLGAVSGVTNFKLYLDVKRMSIVLIPIIEDNDEEKS